MRDILERLLGLEQARIGLQQTQRSADEITQRHRAKAYVLSLEIGHLSETLSGSLYRLCQFQAV